MTELATELGITKARISQFKCGYRSEPAILTQGVHWVEEERDVAMPYKSRGGGGTATRKVVVITEAGRERIEKELAEAEVGRPRVWKPRERLE